jgi:hypothetical protein
VILIQVREFCSCNIPKDRGSTAEKNELDSIQMNHLTRLNRLKAGRRFALATIYLFSEYLLSWTPYTIVALFYLFHMKFIDQQSILMTICVFSSVARNF